MEIEDVKIAHFITGRIRLKVDKAKRSTQVMSQFKSVLGGVHGVSRIEANAATGSILVFYDPAKIGSRRTAEALAAALNELFPSLDMARLLLWLAKMHP